MKRPVNPISEDSVQVIGTAKCRETKKCRLWLDERAVDYHFVDLAKRPLSRGELNAIAVRNSWEAMIDKEGKAWKKLQLEWKDYNPEEELEDEPLLLKTPVIRQGNIALIGFNPGELANITGK